MNPSRPRGRKSLRCAFALVLLLISDGLVASLGVAQVQPTTPASASAQASTEASGDASVSSEDAPAASPENVLVVLPFQVHSSHSFEDLTGTLGDRLAARLASMQGLRVVESARLQEALQSPTAEGPQAELGDYEFSDLQLRQLATLLGADAVVSGSVTELAGRFSLDVRVTSVAADTRSQTFVFVADGEEELLGRIDDAAERVAASSTRQSVGRIGSIAFDGTPELELKLRDGVSLQVGDEFDAIALEAARTALERDPEVASVRVDTSRVGDDIAIIFTVLPASALFTSEVGSEGNLPVVEINVRGHRRLDRGAVLARVGTKVGEPLRSAQLSRDVQELYSTGYFRDIRVYSEETSRGIVLIFEVEENPVIRQISVAGNDKIDDEEIRDVLTLTTGATLDFPLLQENVERIRTLYRAGGYYLAVVSYEIEEIAEGSVGIDFEVEENEKLKLRKIGFEGNEAFSDKQLQEDFAIKRWRFWSPATSWFDKTGTYSEPLFMRDLQMVERMYSDAGYLQVEVDQPTVVANEEGLFVTVAVREGPQFRVGELDVVGDDTMDIAALRGKLRLDEGAVFNRSFLTSDVEALEQHYTDRGFYFASVQPRTRLSQDEQVVDVEFGVTKGPLYFIRHVNISGNTRTVDPVIRREMNLVEGELYSARALQLSDIRVRQLGFFEDVAFEPVTTEDPSQLDLEVSVVERPTGSFSFGAGYSSQDKVVFTASLAQANLFGRGYGVNLSADVGGSTNRFYFSFSDPSFLESDWSVGATVFFTDVEFDSFESRQAGFDINFGHSISEDNLSRGFARYSYSQRRVIQDTSLNAAAPIFREILQGNESASLIGLTLRRDTRNDRYAPTGGIRSALTLDYAGLGGFANFFRIEANHAMYFPAPRWLIKGSSFVVGARLGYVFPFNTVDDYDLRIDTVPGCYDPGQCIEVKNLDQISRDLKLPLTERYFLGGIGTFQLRGFKARTVGPRRAQLRRSGAFGSGSLFLPVGREEKVDPVTGKRFGICNDTNFRNQGNGDGECNSLTDTDLDDFDDLDETDVVGGNKFITATVEYRFPISEEIGLQGVLFLDMGGSFAEEERLFDFDRWRYGYGAGVLWFSPFGPLQLVLGFPVNPYSFEKSPVFEFSVGGFGL